MAGQLVRISDHKISMMATRRARPAAQARIYRFSTPTPLTHSELSADTVVKSPPRNRRNPLHLATELGIGLGVWVAVWLSMFLWGVLHSRPL